MSTLRQPQRKPAGRLQEITRSSLNHLHRNGRWPAPPMWREASAAAEYVSLLRDPVFRGRDIPLGDGRPVLLISGFLAGDWTLRTPHDWLRRIGYRAYLPGLLLNLTYSEVVMRRLVDRLHSLRRRRRAKVTLIGHSRGGVLAKVLSHRQPEMVEQVITLGSPLGDPFDVHPLTMAGVRAAHAYNVFRYGRPASVEEPFLRDLAAEPKVPITSIYTRSDGVVNWAACLRPDVRAIEVRGSHVGLTVNPDVYRLLAFLLPVPAHSP